MIEFQREGSQVKITIDSDAMGTRFNFYHECHKDHFAFLMMKSYDQKRLKVLEEIRRDAYNEGWKDAKAKVGKRTWFSGWW